MQETASARGMLLVASCVLYTCTTKPIASFGCLSQGKKQKHRPYAFHMERHGTRLQKQVPWSVHTRYTTTCLMKQSSSPHAFRGPSTPSQHKRRCPPPTRQARLLKASSVGGRVNTAASLASQEGAHTMGGDHNTSYRLVHGAVFLGSDLVSCIT